MKDVAQRYLKPTHRIVDLVGREKVQTSETVRHLALEVPNSERTEAVNDLLKVYGVGKSCIIFCDTKNEANEIALSSSLASKCQVLHGDIAQAQREVTLASFREGKFPCLVATNVAARGLDIAGVELIIQVQSSLHSFFVHSHTLTLSHSPILSLTPSHRSSISPYYFHLHHHLICIIRLVTTTQRD